MSLFSGIHPFSGSLPANQKRLTLDKSSLLENSGALKKAKNLGELEFKGNLSTALITEALSKHKKLHTLVITGDSAYLNGKAQFDQTALLQVNDQGKKLTTLTVSIPNTEVQFSTIRTLARELFQRLNSCSIEMKNALSDEVKTTVQELIPNVQFSQDNKQLFFVKV